jgi:hypothetical protein
MNIVQIQSRVQELPNSPQTMQYLNAAMNGQVTTVPPYIAAAELKRRETEGMMDQLAKGAAQAQQSTVKDQLQQKMGVMALMGQQQPPQQPQIPQPAPPEQQAQAGGIDSLPVKEDMFGMAGGGIVAFYDGGKAGGYETPREESEQREPAPGGQPDRLPGESLDAYRQRLRAFGEAYAQQRNERRRAYEQSEAAQQQGIAERGSPLIPRTTPAAAPALEGPGAKERLSPGDMALRQQPANARPPAPPPGQRPPTAGGQRPPGPQNAGPAAAPQDAQGIKSLVDQAMADPAYKRMMQGVNEKNPYAGPQESQGDYIKRMTEGIRSQMPGGQMPFETSEARLKEIEARRAKEDTDYAESNKGRQLDNLLTMISGMGRGSFGNAGVQGIQAVQGVERSQREADLKRKDMRDQQSMKLMEIRSLNEQAQMALAQGNVQAYEKLTQEAKKLKAEFDKDQAMLAKGAAQVTAGAREKDVESADKARDRASRERQARMGQEGKGTLTPNQRAMIADKAKDNIAKDVDKNFALQTQIRKDPTVLSRLVATETERLLAIAEGRTISAAPGAQGPSGTRPPLSSFQR